MRTIIAGIFAMAVLAGCATDAQVTARQQEKREVVTGSNIPRRDTSDVTIVGREALEQVQRSGTPAPPRN